MERTKQGKTGEQLLGGGSNQHYSFNDNRIYKTGPNFMNKYSSKQPTRNELDMAQNSLTLLKSKMRFNPNLATNKAFASKNNDLDFANNRNFSREDDNNDNFGGYINDNQNFNSKENGMNMNQNDNGQNNNYRRVFKPENQNFKDIERKEKQLINNIGMLNDNLDIQKEILGSHVSNVTNAKNYSQPNTKNFNSNSNALKSQGNMGNNMNQPYYNQGQDNSQKRSPSENNQQYTKSEKGLYNSKMNNNGYDNYNSNYGRAEPQYEKNFQHPPKNNMNRNYQNNQNPQNQQDYQNDFNNYNQGNQNQGGLKRNQMYDDGNNRPAYAKSQGNNRPSNYNFDQPQQGGNKDNQNWTNVNQNNNLPDVNQSNFDNNRNKKDLHKKKQNYNNKREEGWVNVMDEPINNTKGEPDMYSNPNDHKLNKDNSQNQFNSNRPNENSMRNMTKNEKSFDDQAHGNQNRRNNKMPNLNQNKPPQAKKHNSDFMANRNDNRFDDQQMNDPYSNYPPKKQNSMNPNMGKNMNNNFENQPNSRRPENRVSNQQQQNNMYSHSHQQNQNRPPPNKGGSHNSNEFEDDDRPIHDNFNEMIKEEANADQNEQQFKCGEGCGRSFKEEALEKHMRICKKVFQTKRKKFDVSKQRVEGDQAKALKEAEKYSKPTKNNPVKKNQFGEEAINTAQTNKPKWKIQSEAFRAQMKGGQGQENLSAAERKVLNDAMKAGEPDREECPYCSRKFGDAQLKRHQPICKTKADAAKLKAGPKGKLTKPAPVRGRR